LPAYCNIAFFVLAQGFWLDLLLSGSVISVSVVNDIARTRHDRFVVA
jgi:hypothetical protein